MWLCRAGKKTGTAFFVLCAIMGRMSQAGAELQPEKKRVDEESSHKGRVLVISGPTGVGKTKLSLMIAKAVGGEVISADSMQVYRGMDIGTAKVTSEEADGIPHHLIDMCEIDESHNVVDFFHEATSAIRQILARGRVPIVVGGTGFYVHALLYGPPQGPPSVPSIREKLEADMIKYGTERLYETLKERDPEYAATLTHNDRQKIIRALEIIAITGKRVSDFKPSEPKEPLGEFQFHCYFVHLPKEYLYDKIDARCEKMVEMGFVDEVKRLKEQGLEKNHSAAQSIGYRQCLDYLGTEQTGQDFEHFMMCFKRASRRYAKRQFTWFKRETLFHWLDLSRMGLEHASELILRHFRR